MSVKKVKSGGIRAKILLSVMVLTSIAALPTTILFFVGMLPTVMARIADRSRQKTRVLTIGFLNFAACFPFWFDLMQRGHTFANAVDVISHPVTVVIMYSGAAMGYLVEWSLAGFVAGIMVARGKTRLETITKIQKEMVARWGEEVTGELSLDPDGFPIEQKRTVSD